MMTIVTMKLIVGLCYSLNGVPICQEEVIQETSFTDKTAALWACLSSAPGDIASYLSNPPERYKDKGIVIRDWKCGTDLNLKGRA